MLTIDLTEDQVTTTDVVEIVPAGKKMSVTEAQHKLCDAKSRIEQAVDIAEKDVMSRIDEAIAILVDIDTRNGWRELGYKSMCQLIKTELKSGLNLSLSQIYRRVQAAKIRRNLEPICPNIDAMSNQQLLALRKLPSQDWTDTLDEIISTAPRGKVTIRHFKKIVARRIHSVKAAAHLAGNALALPPANKVENLNNDGSSLYKNYQLPASIMELEKPEQNLEVYSKDTSGEIVEYFLTDLNLLENPTPTFIEVSDRTASLWQTPNLPASVRHLLTTFYQRRLDFSQSDKDVLTAIESYVRRGLATDLASKKEDAQTKLQNNLLESGVDNQIPCIISATE